MMSGLTYDNININVPEVIFGALISPFFLWLYNLMKARFGVFSGTYIAITDGPNSNTKIIEVVYCKHINKNLKGKILGVSFLTSSNEVIIDKRQENRYKFKGSVTERLMVVSYYSRYKGDLSSGTLTLLGKTTGNSFEGRWSGLEDGEIVSSNCTWIKVDRRFSIKRDYNEIIEKAKLYINLNHPTLIMGDNVSGKSGISSFLKIIQNGQDKR